MAKATFTYCNSGNDKEETIIEKCGHDFKMITGVLKFGAYETGGGVSCDFSGQIPTEIHQVIIEPKGGYVPVYDYTTNCIVVYVQDSSSDAALIELATTADLASAMTDCRFTAIGR